MRLVPNIAPVIALLTSVTFGMLSGCETAPSSAGEKAALTAESSAALASFKAKDKTLQELLDKSVGYAIFPDVGKAGFVIGGSYGRGEVYAREKAGFRKIGYADITQGTFGLQIGAQTFSELVIFINPGSLLHFKKGDFSLEANASAVAITAGAAATSDHSKGVIVFVEAKGGLMAEAAIAGQVLGFKPM